MNTKYFNTNYDGSDIPLGVGDRYYAQDLGRDLYHDKEYGATICKEIINKSGNIIIKDAIVSQGAGHTINITEGTGIVDFKIKTPTDWSTLPPVIGTTDIPIFVEIPALTNQSITGATTDGITTNYVKIAYSENFIQSRARAKKVGSYFCETENSYILTVDSTPALNTELILATFTTDGTTLTFTDNIERGINFPKKDNIGSSCLEAGDIILKKSTILNTNIPEANLGAISGLTASSWHFLVIREDTKVVSLEEIDATFLSNIIPPNGQTWSPIIATNNLDMLNLYDFDKNYCRYTLAGKRYRILYLFKVNASQNNFAKASNIKISNKPKTIILLERVGVLNANLNTYIDYPFIAVLDLNNEYDNTSRITIKENGLYNYNCKIMGRLRRNTGSGNLSVRHIFGNVSELNIVKEIEVIDNQGNMDFGLSLTVNLCKDGEVYCEQKYTEASPGDINFATFEGIGGQTAILSITKLDD